MDLTYDGTLEGFLSVVFYIYENKLEEVNIHKESRYQPALFGAAKFIETDAITAERVLKGIKKKTGRQFGQFFYAAHNDRDDIENDLLSYIRYVLGGTQKRSTDYGHPAVLQVAKYAKSVGREKHRMDAFIRFRLTKDGVYFAAIEPDFDVVPLIKKHFRERYGDQKWLIYDLARDYGIFYDLDKVKPVKIAFNQNKIGLLDTPLEMFSEEELQFQELWAQYFKHTNIVSRKNMKLHLQHVPRRYWKYLTEKVQERRIE